MKTPDGRIVRPTGFSRFKGSHWFCGDDKDPGCGRRWVGKEEGKDWVHGLNDLFAVCRWCEGKEEVLRDEDTNPGWSMTFLGATFDQQVCDHVWSWYGSMHSSGAFEMTRTCTVCGHKEVEVS